MNSVSLLKTYLDAIAANLKAGNATEHTHRPALKTLLESLGSAVSPGGDIRATNEPRHIECGAPDFILTRGVLPLGYVEAKDVGVSLGKTASTEQLKRYRASLANLMLTDYIDFHWYLDGELKLSASLPRPGKDGKFRWNADAAAEVAQLLSQFIQADIPLKATPQDLAMRMAGLAQLIRSLIEETFKAEGEQGELHAQLQSFRTVLLDTLTPAQFADMYAQTLCYGLFAARCTLQGPGAGFTRQSAASQLPKTNPFLRKLFHQIAGPDLDDRIAWAVDQLAALLARADMAAILEQFGLKTRQEDPVVHFYETFLAAYDPRMREARGVYYTPEPVVGYIVRSVDALLKSDFGMRDGLACADKITVKVPPPDEQVKKGNPFYVDAQVHRLQILDPATGTGTFLHAVIQQIRQHFTGNAGAWPGYVADHLLPRLFGFELLMAPYAVAHMKLGLTLEASGYDFASDQRLGVYLTNSLEEAHELKGLPLFTQFLADESRAASGIKRDAPVMVVLGNPPYSGHSENKGDWIESLMREYKQSPALKKPAQAKWLSDDYVKFIRFAQWRIEKTGYGILAFVTNHSYLDNPTFMDMRRSLMRSFDEIYLLDLHGNSKKKEKTPDGGKDDNVFDIQQGVAIGIFVRKPPDQRIVGEVAKVFRADISGLRADKYRQLDSTDVKTTDWQVVAPQEPAYLFVAQNKRLLGEYESGWSVRDIFSPNGDPAPGIVTTHDEFAISWTPEEAGQKVERLLATETESEARQIFKLCSQSQWNYSRAKKDLADNQWKEKIVPILYRPFDVRWTVYDKNVAVHRRERAFDHFIKRNNFGLSIMRQVSADGEFNHVCIVNAMADNRFQFSSKGVMAACPLFLYPRPKNDLLEDTETERRANLSPEFTAALTTAQARPITPEDTLAYLYAVLYTPGYRARYADFLKRDFPRVPLTTDKKLFATLVELGHELIGLHTLQTVPPRITGFPVAGTGEVVKPRLAIQAGHETGRVWINDAQYFDGVPQTVWDMHIGGYRVAEKWLKDRKGRLLSFDDVTHYQSVVAALARTLAIQTALDAAVGAAGGWPLQ